MSDIDALVDRAVAAVSALARRGSTLTTGVAIVAAVVLGATYVVGLAAFGGGTRTTWAVIGAVLFVIAVGAPLLASFRLRSIPKQAGRLVGELRTLLNRDESARRVIVDTVEAEPLPAATTARGGFGPAGFGGTRPEVVLQFQRLSALRNFATSADVRSIGNVARTIGLLPALLSAGIGLSGLGAFLGFIFMLIWIF
jgi:hypothetical protein